MEKQSRKRPATEPHETAEHQSDATTRDQNEKATVAEARSTLDDTIEQLRRGPLSRFQSQRHGDRIIISFYPSDPEHPNNWSRKMKLLLAVAGCLSVINSTLGSSFPSGTIDQISQHFRVTNEPQLVLPISCYLMGYVIGPILFGPLSEYLGRKSVMVGAFTGYILFTMACAVAPTWAAFLVFRLICGTVASAPVAIVGGLFADIYADPKPRGLGMAWFTCATSCGPVLSPVISGFIGQSTSWRWVFGTGTFIALIPFPLLVLAPESYLPVILSRKAAELRKETGNQNIIAATDLEKQSLKYILTVIMTRPYRMLFQETIVACVCLYSTLLYAIYYLYFEVYPIIFQGPDSVYGFSPGITGLAFLPIAAGSVFTGTIFIAWDNYCQRATAKGQTWVKCEEYRRLPIACIGGPLYSIAMFWLGWSAKPDINYMAPIMSGFLFGLGYFLTFTALLNYVSDAYLTFAASAQGMASTCRSIGGALLPLASNKMYKTLGNSWACSLLGLLNLAVATIPFVFIKYGDKIRASSKFCVELRRLQDEEAERHERGRIGNREDEEV
ncbi:transporter [Aspergillus sclerotialis]|uniref:Transporter n=1 Tax=Aspergillus sclerotialis TaxID=2070753 RepID=A0A3A2ZLI8_9EURO|nr:transporter [Aspergillus sclerotialis]